MIRPLIELITCQSGDWEVLQVNLGYDFICEGHKISNEDWIKLLKELGYRVTKKCLSDEVMGYGDYNVEGLSKMDYGGFALSIAFICLMLIWGIDLIQKR